MKEPSIEELEQVLLDDPLLKTKEFKPLNFDLPPIETAFIEEETEEAKAEKPQVEELEIEASAEDFEDTAEALFEMSNMGITLAQWAINKKFEAKLTAEQWHKLRQIDLLVEKGEDLDKDDKDLLLKKEFNEKELQRIKDQLEIGEAEAQKVIRITSKFCEANNFVLGPNTNFLAKLGGVFGPRVALIVSVLWSK